MPDPADLLLPAVKTNLTLPAYPGSDRISCEVWGCAPAAYATFRRHQGLILLMRFRSTSGQFCRNCGVEVFRSMTAATLVQGWWGFLSFFVTPVVVLANLVSRREIAALPAPQQVPGGRRPVEPGPRLLARPAAVIGLFIPVVIIGVVVAMAVQ